MDFNVQYYLLNWCWCRRSPDCRSFPSSLWSNEPSFLSQVTSFTPNPRMHHLPALSYSSQPSPYCSYLPPPPAPLSHGGPFQPGSFYYGPNQPLQTAGEDRNVVTALSNYIEGACLSLRGEEPVWRPYWLLITGCAFKPDFCLQWLCWFYLLLFMKNLLFYCFWLLFNNY